MLVTLVLFLRESLEAALLISILMAITQRSGYRRYWVMVAILSGLVLSAITAAFLGDITRSFNGFGQELMNIFLLFLMMTFLWLVFYNYAGIFVRSFWQLRSKPKYGLIVLFTLAATISITHEGAELSVYIYAYAQNSQALTSIFLGGSIGIAIGVSIGAIIYYVLVLMPLGPALILFRIILLLTAAGTALQISTYILQGGWLPSPPALWDTSSILTESSLGGQLMYGLFSYEASPNIIQAGFYMVTLVFFIATLLIRQGATCKTETTW